MESLWHGKSLIWYWMRWSRRGCLDALICAWQKLSGCDIYCDETSGCCYQHVRWFQEVDLGVITLIMLSMAAAVSSAEVMMEGPWFWRGSVIVIPKLLVTSKISFCHMPGEHAMLESLVWHVLCRAGTQEVGEVIGSSSMWQCAQPACPSMVL